MKRKLLLTLLISIMSLSASAYHFMVDGIAYDITSDSESVSVTYTTSAYPTASKHSSYSGNIVIPSKVTYSGKTYTVKVIDFDAFCWCDGLTSVTIPNSVTSIGQSAFESCSGLTSVTIPNSVTSIGVCAFSHCSGLTSVTIPNSVTSIGGYAFSKCSGLSKVNIESIESWCSINFSSITSHPFFSSENGHLFMNGTEVTSLTIPQSISKLNSFVFYGCSGLTSVTIPNSLTSIGAYAFYRCDGLTSVTIPNSVTSIGGYAFSNCSGLTSVTIPNSVTSIGEGAFRNCSSLASVNIPKTVTDIGSYAFYGCSELESFHSRIERPGGVVTYGSNIFDYTTKQKATLYIPKDTKILYFNTLPWSEFLNIQEEGDSEPIKGDVNGDGKLDVTDVTALINMILQ
ncbi:MAG: leucine-rich repeat protein [Sodaliphilus sp.]|nr:leucine-rich repeat protein [Sodaliphilus sp.]